MSAGEPAGPALQDWGRAILPLRNLARTLHWVTDALRDVTELAGLVTEMNQWDVTFSYRTSVEHFSPGTEGVEHSSDA